MDFLEQDINIEKKNKNLKNSLLNKYYQELDEDLNLTLANIQDKNLRCSSIRAKWLMYLTKEKENRKLLKKTKDELKNSLLNKQEADSNKSILRQKNEDNILKDNEQLKKLNDTIDQFDEIIIFLEYTWNIMNDFGYNIKNIIELIKLEQV